LRAYQAFLQLTVAVLGLPLLDILFDTDIIFVVQLPLD